VNSVNKVVLKYISIFVELLSKIKNKIKIVTEVLRGLFHKPRKMGQ
jgi:hypothetical protein